MPTILRKFGFRFFFYSNEGNEPPHVHIEKGNGRGKYWIDPVEKEYMKDFNQQEEKKADEIVHQEQGYFKKNGMNSLVDTQDLKAVSVRIETEMFYVLLEDGREIGIPYTWFWRLAEATPLERENWRFISDGYGIHWEDLDEDISIAGILKGNKDPVKK